MFHAHLNNSQWEVFRDSEFLVYLKGDTTFGYVSKLIRNLNEANPSPPQRTKQPLDTAEALPSECPNCSGSGVVEARDGSRLPDQCPDCEGKGVE